MTAPGQPGGAPPGAALDVGHLDDAGARCARHPEPTTAGLLQLAMVGSRASAFHHDCASKLQGLVMALDELTELTENGDPDLIRAIEAALESTRELHALLNMNRALTKAPVKAPLALGELVAAAARRIGIAVHGELPAATLLIAAPAVTHALALAFEVAAGTGRGRSLTLRAAVGAGYVELELPTAATMPPHAGETLAIASFAIGRDGGRLWCAAGDERMFVRLPTA